MVKALTPYNDLFGRLKDIGKTPEDLIAWFKECGKLEGNAQIQTLMELAVVLPDSIEYALRHWKTIIKAL